MVSARSRRCRTLQIQNTGQQALCPPSVSPIEGGRIFCKQNRRSAAHWRALRESNPCFRRERAMSWTARRRARRGEGIERFAEAAKQLSIGSGQLHSPLAGVRHRCPGFLRRKGGTLL